MKKTFSMIAILLATVATASCSSNSDSNNTSSNSSQSSAVAVDNDVYNSITIKEYSKNTDSNNDKNIVMITQDGSWRSKNTSNSQSKGKLSNSEWNSLKESLKNTKLEESSEKSQKSCNSDNDGTDYDYSWTDSNGAHLYSTCLYNISDTDSFVVEAQKIMKEIF